MLMVVDARTARRMRIPMRTIAECRRCHGVLVQTPGGWGHAVNPAARHHYPAPIEATIATVPA